VNLTPWQHVKRRISLLGGSYTHPDGHIELDIDAAAGVTRDDDSDTAYRKFERYEARRAAKERTGNRAFGAMLVAIGIYYLEGHMGVTGWDALVIAVAIAIGLFFVGA
jgi:hypothetical protein